MKDITDQWYLMGEENLGPMNIKWGERVGWDILMKSIINDHWADASKQDWSAQHVSYVMSKLYYVTCRYMFEVQESEE